MNSSSYTNIKKKNHYLFLCFIDLLCLILCQHHYLTSSICLVLVILLLRSTTAPVLPRNALCPPGASQCMAFLWKQKDTNPECLTLICSNGEAGCRKLIRLSQVLHLILTLISELLEKDFWENHPFKSSTGIFIFGFHLTKIVVDYSMSCKSFDCNGVVTFLFESASVIDGVKAMRNQAALSNNNPLEFNYKQISPADLRTACNQDNPVALLEVEMVMGANFSFLMLINVELEEQTPVSLNSPFASVWAWTSLGWLARATLAPATGTPVTLRTAPCSTWPSHTHRLQSSLGRPSVHTRWHWTVVRKPKRHTWRLMKTPKLNNT